MQTAITVSVVHESKRTISPKKKKQAATAQHDSKPAITYKRKRKGPVVTFEEPKSKKMMSSNKLEKAKRLVKPRKLKLLGCVDQIDHFNCNHPPIPTGHESRPKNAANSSSLDVPKSPMQRAIEVRDNLSSLGILCFIKEMSQSHVTRGFWLGLPKTFSKHLPKKDVMIPLQVGDNKHEHEAKYLVNRCGLSGGWRGFSRAQKLDEEDVLVFQRVKPCKFKVHIMRAKSSPEIGAATSLLKLKFHAEQKMIEASDNSLELVAAPSENDDNEETGQVVHPNASSSETMDGMAFKSVASFKDFHINVDGSMIDAEIPRHLRRKYYKLCRSQKAFLHVQCTNTKLAAPMIRETIDIADAIGAAKPSTSVSQLRKWDTILKAFEGLGMAVGFLRARIDKLLTQAQIELKERERAEAIDEIQRLVEKLPDLKKMIEKLSEELDGLVAKNEEVAAAPWW